MSLFTDHLQRGESPSRTQGSGVGGRLRNGAGARVRSLDQEGSGSNPHAE
jgi:hypothetical protein